MAESKGIQSDLIPKIATGFCGGVARTCRTCGAVNGAIMALSLFYGRSSPDESQESAYDAVRQFLSTFENKFGSTNCQTLTGYDLGSKEGHDAFMASPESLEQCAMFTAEATAIVVTMIQADTAL